MVEESISRPDYDLVPIGDLYARFRDAQNAASAAIASADPNLV